MPTETQQHPLASGSLEINRNSQHQYWLTGGDKVPSVTGLIGFVDGDGFGAGMGWALKVAREQGGDLEAPRRVAQEAKDLGTQLHDAINAYIYRGVVAEENPVFVAWLKEFSNERWLASERFVYSSNHAFGGTVDALSLRAQGATLFDWKTVDRSSWEKHESSLRMAKDSAQIAAYAHALNEMGSRYAPISEAHIAYVLRDGSKCVVEEVDLDWGLELFLTSRKMYQLRKQN